MSVAEKVDLTMSRLGLQRCHVVTHQPVACGFQRNKLIHFATLTLASHQISGSVAPHAEHIRISNGHFQTTVAFYGVYTESQQNKKCHDLQEIIFFVSQMRENHREAAPQTTLPAQIVTGHLKPQ